MGTIHDRMTIYGYNACMPGTHGDYMGSLNRIRGKVSVKVSIAHTPPQLGLGLEV